MLKLENSYRAQLPSQFYEDQVPISVAHPELLCFNDSLAQDLKIDEDFSNPDLTKNILSGKQVLKNTNPIAQAYAGHQFGQFTMLGDGRAVLLGEQVVDGNRFDVQLKGSGITKYSRRGDGRATLSSMLREYLMSEAMFYLGVKTTRSLAVVKTGEPVYREKIFDGGVLTRIAQSHIRVGTFEYARFYTGQLETFTKYVIERHDPDLLRHDNYALEFLKNVIDRQIDLIVDWMRVGFIHGVMNTDNMSIAGETIDYGPCAFMNTYHPKTVFSSIDRQGRYAFGNQPHIAHWNLSILANSILPLIAKNEKEAVASAEAVLHTFPDEFARRYSAMMCAKLGITHSESSDNQLVDDLLALLAKHSIDYTNFFVSLRYDSIDNRLLADQTFMTWHSRWQKAFNRSANKEDGLAFMDQNNPIIIPRNHLIEESLSDAIAGNMFTFNNLLQKLSKPYAHQDTQQVPTGYDQNYQTFCGT
ncbi:MAG: protein adenylyltransferase SelO family protein [Reichenbachiella sp.]|uniref:protein adenylyltransferase SelO n=1 Tax=Reichenbachiella sp. TaxID=2184521 RepID=UPI003297FC35